MIKTSHIVVQASINRIKGRFILDTGASNSCIDKEKYDVFNLTLKNIDLTATGAGTDKISVKLTKGNIVEIGLWQKRKIKFVIINLSHINTTLASRGCEPVDGIIGADILKRGKGIIDYQKLSLYLK